MNSIYDWSIRFILAIQEIGAWLLAPMLFFSFVGTEQFYLLFIPILYWCIDTTLGLRVSLILGVSNRLKEVLKLAFHQPRPFWYRRSGTGKSTRELFWDPNWARSSRCCGVGHASCQRERKMGEGRRLALNSLDRTLAGIPGGAFPNRCGLRLADRIPARLAIPAL